MLGHRSLNYCEMLIYANEPLCPLVYPCMLNTCICGDLLSTIPYSPLLNPDKQTEVEEDEDGRLDQELGCDPQSDACGHALWVPLTLDSPLLLFQAFRPDRSGL